MSVHLLRHVLVYIYLLRFCAGVHVYIEDGKRRAFVRFPTPVMDGFILTAERNLDLIEFRKFEENEEHQINLIANFPELENINISYGNLEKMPKFLNLPKADWLLFDFNKLTKIPSNSFASLPLTTVTFTGNIISTIEDGSFGMNVTDLYLDCNLITEILPNWFKNPSALIVLQMKNNKIIVLEENLFEKFTNLKTINLSYNQIISIGNGAFAAQSTMAYLILQANNISILQPEIFGPSINITNSFNIARNRLNFLAKNLLAKLHLKQFIMLGNPWQCPCLREIEKWMTVHVNDPTYDSYLLKWSETNPVCIVASSFSKQCVELVDSELYNSYVINLNIDNSSGC